MNNSVDTQSLMLQMRSLAAEAASKTPTTPQVGSPENGVEATENFADLMAKGVNAVNEQQQQSTEMKNAFEKGEDVDLSDVMLQVQKASLSFQAMTQVRNKLVEAYKDVMHLPI